MRRPPRSEAEWVAWNAFELHENGRNRHMDLGDLAVALQSVGEEFDTAHTESINASDHVGSSKAETQAAYERVESALNTLAALSGGSYPHELGDARPAAGKADELLESVTKLLAEAEGQAAEAAQLLAGAARDVSQYVERLLAGGF